MRFTLLMWIPSGWTGNVLIRAVMKVSPPHKFKVFNPLGLTDAHLTPIFNHWSTSAVSRDFVGISVGIIYDCWCRWINWSVYFDEHYCDDFHSHIVPHAGSTLSSLGTEHEHSDSIIAGLREPNNTGLYFMNSYMVRKMIGIVVFGKTRFLGRCSDHGPSIMLNGCLISCFIHAFHGLWGVLVLYAYQSVIGVLLRRFEFDQMMMSYTLHSHNFVMTTTLLGRYIHWGECPQMHVSHVVSPWITCLGNASE